MILPIFLTVSSFMSSEPSPSRAVNRIIYSADLLYALITSTSAKERRDFCLSLTRSLTRSFYTPDIFRTKLYFRKRKSCLRRVSRHEIGRATISLLPRHFTRSITERTEISPAQNTVQRAVVKAFSYIRPLSLFLLLSLSSLFCFLFLPWPVSTTRY